MEPGSGSELDELKSLRGGTTKQSVGCHIVLSEYCSTGCLRHR